MDFISNLFKLDYKIQINFIYEHGRNFIKNSQLFQKSDSSYLFHFKLIDFQLLNTNLFRISTRLKESILREMFL